MGRLEASAKYFRFAFDKAVVLAALENEIKGRGGERLRVRLLLAEDGKVTVTHAPQPATPAGTVWRFVVSPTRLSSADAFLYHKTTRRDVYDREWAHYHDTAGADEVIYLNERDEVAEGSRTNIFIQKSGKLLTPALSSGLLPGTLRAELLAAGRAEEAVLTLADLATADGIYLGNSVRGLVAARPIDEP